MEHQFYEQIKRILSEARNKVYQTANFAMVEAYWNIGKSIDGLWPWTYTAKKNRHPQIRCRFFFCFFLHGLSPAWEW